MKSIIIGFFSLFLCLNTTIDKKQLTAYIFVAEECPVCNNIGKPLSVLSEEYEGRVQFVAVFPHILSDSATVYSFVNKYEWNHFNTVIDASREITEKYNASVTPEVVLVDSHENIIYQGRINDAYAAPGRMRHGKVKEDLRMALEQFFTNKKVSKPWPAPIGCYITKN